VVPERRDEAATDNRGRPPDVKAAAVTARLAFVTSRSPPAGRQGSKAAPATAGAAARPTVPRPAAARPAAAAGGPVGGGRAQPRTQCAATAPPRGLKTLRMPRVLATGKGDDHDALNKPAQERMTARRESLRERERNRHALKTSSLQTVFSVVSVLRPPEKIWH
jgi:hypothetical protein